MGAETMPTRYDYQRIRIRNHRFRLLPQRAAYWEQRRLLMIADPHFGKAALFRSRGVGVPAGSTLDDLKRLAQVVDAVRPRTLAILGDLLHGAASKTERVLDAFERWRRQFAALELLLVQGNHDRRAGAAPEALAFDHICKQLSLDGVVLVHQPCQMPPRYVWAGHRHPGLAVRDIGGRQTLPCFHVGRQCAVLPAFGSFTGHQPVRPRRGERIYIIVEGKIVSCRF